MAKGAADRRSGVGPGRAAALGDRAGQEALGRAEPRALPAGNGRSSNGVAKPVCQLSPVPRSPEFRLSDLVALFRSLPAADEEWSAAVAEGVAEQDEFVGFEWPR